MWWSRLLPCAVAAILTVGLPPAARSVWDPQEETAAPEPEEDEAAAGSEGEEAARKKAARKAKRKAKRAAEQVDPAAEETPAGEEEPSEETEPDADSEEPDSEGAEDPEDPSSDPDSDSGSDSDTDSDTDSDSDHPAILVIASDGEGLVYVEGLLEGRVAPDEPLEVGVELGEIEVRATSTEVRGAAWEKTLEIEEPGAQAIRIRMKKAIRQYQREERKSGVFRDPKRELMWAKRDNGVDVDLRQAYAYCRDLGTGGFDGWRLPTLEELESLQAIWLRGTYKILGDILLSECCMWSSEYDGSERAWTFNYRFREAFQTNAGYKIGLRALCVREWDPEAEPETDAADDAVADESG